MGWDRGSLWEWRRFGMINTNVYCLYVLCNRKQNIVDNEVTLFVAIIILTI